MSKSIPILSICQSKLNLTDTKSTVRFPSDTMSIGYPEWSMFQLCASRESTRSKHGLFDAWYIICWDGDTAHLNNFPQEQQEKLESMIMIHYAQNMKVQLFSVR